MLKGSNEEGASISGFEYVYHRALYAQFVHLPIHHEGLGRLLGGKVEMLLVINHFE